MISCYAYEKRKDESVRISEGQGRLGQCMVEKEFVFLTDIPSNYLNISSGLGHALPRSVVVVPLMLNEKFYGAIELAFFQILKPHEIEFLKRLSENIAAEISSMQSIQQTQRFLKESESLTLELKQHEAEMQHHLKELEETQEQMQKKQRELNSYLAAINNTIASVEFNMEGHFVNANEIFLKVMGYTMNDLAGRSYQKLFSEDGSMNLMWQNLKEGKFFSGEFKMKDKNGKDIWLSGTFNPIAITNSCPEKVMMFAQFTTQEKEKLHELNAVVNALKATLPVVEFNENFTCKTANEKFLKLFDVTRISLKNKNITDFLDPSYHNVFHKMSAEILSNDFSTIMLPVIIKGRPATFEASISVVHQSENLISRIIVILVKPIEERISEITSAV
jgi:methyl-accepting chemotaxis protein